MSSVDPASSQQRASSITGLDSQSFDPATVLLALSLGQMGILQDSLLSRVPSTRDQVDTLGRIGSTSTQLSKLNDTVLQGEQREADDLLKQMEAFKSRHVTGEESNLVVNDTEQQDLAKALEWAQQRGFPYTELTKEVPVPKPAKTESDAKAEGQKPAEEEPVEMQTVVDEQKFLAFRDALKNYQASLKTGEVDNPAIRSRFTSHPDYDQLSADANSLGITSDLDSPAKIRDAVAELDSQYNQLLKTAQQSAGELRTLVNHVDQATAGLGDLNRSQLQSETRVNDRKADDDRQRIQNLDLDKNRQQQLEGILDAVQSAERALDQISARQAQAKDLVRDMPVSAQLDVQSQLSSWQSDLNKELESNHQAPRPEQRLLRPANAYV